MFCFQHFTMANPPEATFAYAVSPILVWVPATGGRKSMNTPRNTGPKPTARTADFRWSGRQPDYITTRHCARHRLSSDLAGERGPSLPACSSPADPNWSANRQLCAV